MRRVYEGAELGTNELQDFMWLLSQAARRTLFVALLRQLKFEDSEHGLPRSPFEQLAVLVYNPDRAGGRRRRLRSGPRAAPAGPALLSGGPPPPLTGGRARQPRGLAQARVLGGAESPHRKALQRLQARRARRDVGHGPPMIQLNEKQFRSGFC